MYHYVDDTEFVSAMRKFGGTFLQELCRILKEEYGMGCQFFLVGSGKRKLIMQNGNNPVELDYNLNILRCTDFDDCKRIKHDVICAANKILREYRLPDCDDSTSVITTKEIHFRDGNPTGFRIDIAIIVQNEDGSYDRLIHEKNAFPLRDRFYWNRAPYSKELDGKVEYIKQHGQWNRVRDQYEMLKNKYLQQNDHNHPSFICYTEAVSNVYNTRGHWHR